MNIDKMLEELRLHVESLGNNKETLIPVSYYCLGQIIEAGRDHSQDHVTINLINSLEDRIQKIEKQRNVKIHSSDSKGFLSGWHIPDDLTLIMIRKLEEKIQMLEDRIQKIEEAHKKDLHDGYENEWKCPHCGHDRCWFDRTLDENGDMNTRCEKCGKSDREITKKDEYIRIPRDVADGWINYGSVLSSDDAKMRDAIKSELAKTNNKKER